MYFIPYLNDQGVLLQNDVLKSDHYRRIFHKGHNSIAMDGDVFSMLDEAKKCLVKGEMDILLATAVRISAELASISVKSHSKM
jgi:hypothetical protein